MTMEISDLSVDDLRRVADLREQIADLENELLVLIGQRPAGEQKKRPGRPRGQGKPAPKKKVKKGKRKMTPEGLERIREAQRRRWAKAKARKK